MEVIGKIRRSQVLTNCGPGSIIDFRGEDGSPISVVAAGLEKWDAFSFKKGLKNEQVTHHSRLERKLRVRGFRLPPIGEERAKNSPYEDRLIPSYRFPSWHNCPVCNSLKQHFRWDSDVGKSGLYCVECSNENNVSKTFVLPVNFVVTCKNGHLTEFPWDKWVHGKKVCKGSKGLKLESKGAGLKGLIVECLDCGEKRNLDGALTPRKFDELNHKCFGYRPWFGSRNQEECNEKPVAIHRGASNVYFPVAISALDVPPWGDELEENLGETWEIAKSYQDLDDIKNVLKYNRVLEGWPDQAETIDSLTSKIHNRVIQLESNIDIRVEEYMQFIERSNSNKTNHPNFRITHHPIPSEFENLIEHLVSVEKLREVRALRGFTRIYPYEGLESEADFAPLWESPLTWLPAIEVHGEGIFVSLSEESVSLWEERTEVSERAEHANEDFIESWRKQRKTQSNPPIEITPRLLLVHTLSHALATHLSLESGYSTASIRERLYVSSIEPKMCGFLLYTSSTDSEGTLGGLSRQGQPKRIFPLIHAALNDLKWCSSDPLCGSGLLSSAEGSGLSACHSCVFVPETTCEFHNRHLDRTMLIGTLKKPELGYWGEYLSNVKSE